MNIGEMSVFERGRIYFAWKDLFEAAKAFQLDCQHTPSLMENPVLNDALKHMYAVVRSYAKVD